MFWAELTIFENASIQNAIYHSMQNEQISSLNRQRFFFFFWLHAVTSKKTTNNRNNFAVHAIKIVSLFIAKIVVVVISVNMSAEMALAGGNNHSRIMCFRLNVMDASIFHLEKVHNTR